MNSSDLGRIARVTACAVLAAVIAGGCSAQGAHPAGGSAGQARAALAGNSMPTSQSAWMTMLTGTPQSLAAISAATTPGGHSRPAHLKAAIARIHRCLAVARQLRASGHLAAARATRRSCLRRYLRLRIAMLGAIHGQVTVERPGGPRTIAFERGVVKSVSAGSITVTARDGTTWTWSLVRVGRGGSGGTVVVQARHRVGTSALATGEHVLVLGPVVSGTNDARLIVLRH